jgi:hypothetical protein
VAVPHEKTTGLFGLHQAVMENLRGIADFFFIPSSQPLFYQKLFVSSHRFAGVVELSCYALPD